MKTKLQCIFTFNRGLDQVMIDYKKVPKTALENEKNFIVFVKNGLYPIEQANLRKISACIQSKERPPDWFMNCRGKIYFN